ncbi:MAG: hypothetical protein ACKVHP_23495 [Verrucomicrobiales bacterium]|jgi:hypothetical protein
MRFTFLLVFVVAAGAFSPRSAYSQDEEEASREAKRTLLRKVAESGTSEDQFYFSVLMGADREEEQLKWLRKAAERGHLEAQQIRQHQSEYVHFRFLQSQVEEMQREIPSLLSPQPIQAQQLTPQSNFWTLLVRHRERKEIS